MHAEAMAWVAYYSRECGDPAVVLDLGGRDVNGTPRPFFPKAEYVSLDILPGADIEADAADWTPDREYDLIISTELFEHAERWRDIIRTAYEAARTGAYFLVTCAGPGRAPHSGVDGREVREWEHYGNVSAADMQQALEAAGWTVEAVEEYGQDTRAFARKE